MGMVLQLFAITDDRLRAAFAPAPSPQKKRLFGLLPAKASEKDMGAMQALMDDLFSFEDEASNPNSDDLDKAWDVIRVALEDMCQAGAIPKGAEVAVTGSEGARGGPMGEFGWVPAAQVPSILEALEAVDMTALDTAIGNVPDSTYLAGAREEGHDYFLDNFERLRRFYRHANGEDKAVICVIC